MVIRSVVALAAVMAGFAAYRLWKLPPRRLHRLSLQDLGLSGPAIVQFSTTSCAPCRVARPKLMEAAREASVDYAQIELDERPEVASRYRIRTVPTIVVTGPKGEVLGVWTRLPQDGQIVETARRAKAA